MDGLANSQQLVWIFRFNHLQKAAQALPVDVVRRSLHAETH
jgi:hypothetical protein